MRFFVPLETADPQTDPEFAGMTQVMNVHVRTILVTDEGNYLFPRAVAMVNSNSVQLQSCLEKGWVAVIASIPASSEPEAQPESKKKKKSSSTEQTQPEEQEQLAPEEEQAPEASAEDAEQVAPQDEDNSL